MKVSYKRLWKLLIDKDIIIYLPIRFRVSNVFKLKISAYLWSL